MRRLAIGVERPDLLVDFLDGLPAFRDERRGLGVSYFLQL